MPSSAPCGRTSSAFCSCRMPLMESVRLDPLSSTVASLGMWMAWLRCTPSLRWRASDDSERGHCTFYVNQDCQCPQISCAVSPLQDNNISLDTHPLIVTISTYKNPGPCTLRFHTKARPGSGRGHSVSAHPLNTPKRSCGLMVNRFDANLVHKISLVKCVRATDTLYPQSHMCTLLDVLLRRQRFEIPAS